MEDRATEVAGSVEKVHVKVLPDGRMCRRDAAAYLGMKPKTLSMWALDKTGPASIKVGGRVFYYRDDLDRFIRDLPPIVRTLPPTECELNVIEAAQDWADATEGSKYGPMQPQIKQAEIALMGAMADLAAENDGRWTR